MEMKQLLTAYARSHDRALGQGFPKRRDPVRGNFCVNQLHLTEGAGTRQIKQSLVGYRGPIQLNGAQVLAFSKAFHPFGRDCIPGKVHPFKRIQPSQMGEPWSCDCGMGQNKVT